MSEYTNVAVVPLPLEEIHRSHAIRQAVFVKEQGYSLELELDENDPICLHWLATCEKDGVPVDVGTIRLWPKPDGLAKLGRFCVLSSARGLHIGQLLVETFIAHCKQNGFHTIVLHGQYPRRGFYQKMGFVLEEGDDAIFLEGGEPHVRMWMRNL
ncbi:hypothetical protein INT47_000049 [Mucor saturninus]|uniref:N-acetyltransferase domain-containing protein n=1 Tax=Mucor saturninus TaxID=64648 RepID=A0A8H7RI29_9FUNG|nr:hypothetical protein INT47_000049 [Mucor saturninus]